MLRVRVLCFSGKMKKNKVDNNHRGRQILRGNDGDFSKTANLGQHQFAAYSGILPGLLDLSYSVIGQLNFKLSGRKGNYFEVPTSALK